MTTAERRAEAKRLKGEKSYLSAIIHYEILQVEDLSDWNDYFLSVCYRHTKQFQKAWPLVRNIVERSPSFQPIKNEILWLTYSDKIKNINNDNVIEDAEDLLLSCDISNRFTGPIFIKTVLEVVSQYKEAYPSLALTWLEKLNPLSLTNTVYRFNNITYPSDKKRYYILYADVLIASGNYMEFIREKLAFLSFSESKLEDFTNYIQKSLTFETYSGSEKISNTKLALYIKNLQEEVIFKGLTNPKTAFQDKTLVSVANLSSFLFCPVSLAINLTFDQYQNESWEKDEWKNEKLRLGDRYSFFNGDNIYRVFQDTKIEQTSKMIEEFSFILNSKLVTNNTGSAKPNIIFGSNPNIVGVPDYIFKSPNGDFFVVTEKFSYGSHEEVHIPFKSDLIKPSSFLNSFPELNLKFGLLLTWFWTTLEIDDHRGKFRKIVVSSYNIAEVKKTEQNQNAILDIEKDIRKFKTFRTHKVEGKKLSDPKKCLNCSVVSFCYHKTGRFNTVNLPYTLLTT